MSMMISTNTINYRLIIMIEKLTSDIYIATNKCVQGEVENFELANEQIWKADALFQFLETLSGVYDREAIKDSLERLNEAINFYHRTNRKY